MFNAASRAEEVNCTTSGGWNNNINAAALCHLTANNTAWGCCSTQSLYYAMLVRLPMELKAKAPEDASWLAGLVSAAPHCCHTPATVYILDDGKDASKKAWVKNLGEDRVIYIPGHIKGENEINGKAHNLNNALGMIYPPGHEIPLEEVSSNASRIQAGS